MSDNKFIAKLADLIVSYKVRFPPDRKMLVPGSSLEGDGRKLKGVVRELREDGYLTNDDPIGNDYTLTDLALNQIEGTAPKLGVLWENQLRSHREFPAVVPWASLSLSEKKYVLDHQSDYTFYIGKLWSGRGELAVYHPGTNEYWKLADEDRRFLNGDTQPYIGTDALSDHVKAFVRNTEVERVYKIAMESGLRHFGVLPMVPAQEGEKEQKLLSVGDSMCIFGGGDNLTFTPNPEKWESEVEAKVGAFLDEIVKATEKLRLLQHIQVKIKAYGGWEKYLADYRKVVEESVDNKMPEVQLPPSA